MRNMWLSKREIPIVLVNVAYTAFFLNMALRGSNYEFVAYTGVVIVIAVWVLSVQKKLQFGTGLLWGLTVWGFLHMAGGNIRMKDDVLYGLQLIPVVLRYDQAVHAFGFFLTALVCHHLLQRYLRPEAGFTPTLAVLTILMSSGAGAINEIVEFIMFALLPETGVGDYKNTALDLVFNLLGGIVAILWIAWHRQTATRRSSTFTGSRT